MPRDMADWERSWGDYLGQPGSGEALDDSPRKRGEVDMSPEAVAERAGVELITGEARAAIQRGLAASHRLAEAAARGREAINQGRETLSTAIERGREAYQQARSRDEA